MSLKKRPLPVVEPVAESRGEAPRGETERSVVRVGGMDCASCAVTVERRVALLDGVSRAAAGGVGGCVCAGGRRWGMPIFRAALGALRVRRADMNVLMSAAAIGAVGIGAWGEAALVISLFAAGNALQSYAVGRTRDAVRELAGFVPDEALVRRGGEEVTVPASEVAAGETVIIRPGERIAVDAEVLAGR